MIVHLKENISIEDAENISRDIEGKLIFNEKNKLIITSSKKNTKIELRSSIKNLNYFSEDEISNLLK